MFINRFNFSLHLFYSQQPQLYFACGSVLSKKIPGMTHSRVNVMRPRKLYVHIYRENNHQTVKNKRLNYKSLTASEIFNRNLPTSLNSGFIFVVVSFGSQIVSSHLHMRYHVLCVCVFDCLQSTHSPQTRGCIPATSTIITVVYMREGSFRSRWNRQWFRPPCQPKRCPVKTKVTHKHPHQRTNTDLSSCCSYRSGWVP